VCVCARTCAPVRETEREGKDYLPDSIVHNCEGRKKCVSIVSYVHCFYISVITKHTFRLQTSVTKLHDTS
jgi:hypothetical protein